MVLCSKRDNCSFSYRLTLAANEVVVIFYVLFQIVEGKLLVVDYWFELVSKLRKGITNMFYKRGAK